MATPTLEEKLLQLQLMSAPASLAAWGERHPAERAPVREVLENLVDRELARRSEQKVAARSRRRGSSSSRPPRRSTSSTARPRESSGADT